MLLKGHTLCCAFAEIVAFEIRCLIGSFVLPNLLFQTQNTPVTQQNIHFLAATTGQLAGQASHPQPKDTQVDSGKGIGGEY